MLLAFVVISSGCIDAEASLSMESVGGEELGEKASVDIKDIHVDFEEVIAQGSYVTPESPINEVLNHNFPVLYNENLYSINRTEAGTEERIRVEYKRENKSKTSNQIRLT